MYLRLFQEELADVPKVSFTLDGWMSPTQESFLVMTSHWVDANWVLQDVILGFEKLSGRCRVVVLIGSVCSLVNKVCYV
jgi:hypothetical protein